MVVCNSMLSWYTRQLYLMKRCLVGFGSVYFFFFFFFLACICDTNALGINGWFYQSDTIKCNLKEKYPQLSHTFANCLQHRAPTLVALIYWSFVGCIQELKNLFYCLFVRTSWEIEWWFHKHFVNNCFLGVCWHWDVNLEWSKYCESWILKVQLLHHCKRCTLTAYVPFCLQFCFIWPAQCFQVCLNTAV